MRVILIFLPNPAIELGPHFVSEILFLALKLAVKQVIQEHWDSIHQPITLSHIFPLRSLRGLLNVFLRTHLILVKTFYSQHKFQVMCLNFVWLQRWLAQHVESMRYHKLLRLLNII